MVASKSAFVAFIFTAMARHLHHFGGARIGLAAVA
jgi:hypothetical protein